MFERKIKLSTYNGVKDFVTFMEHNCPTTEAFLISPTNDISVHAISIVGIFALNLLDPIILKIYGNLDDNFINKLDNFFNKEIKRVE